MTTGLSERSIPVPEPDLTPAEMLARAEGFRERLLEEQWATEERGYYSEELHDAFRDAGFYRMLQPRRYGGYEFDLPDFARVIMSVSRGCPSSGWCLCLASAHAMQVASLFSEQAQADVFGPDGDFRAPSRGTPMGTAVPADGGWVVNGTWDYCSGAPYATHFLPVAFENPADPSTIVLAIVPREQWTMLDDWGHVLGMRGSGSHSIKVEDALVPEHFVERVNMLDVDVTNGTPGYRLHGNPLYAGRTLGFFYVEIVAIVTGAARAAVDEYDRILRERKTYLPPFVPRHQHHEFQRPFGLALALVDAAEATVIRTADQYMEYSRRGVEGGEPFTSLEDTRLYAQLSMAFRQAWEATELLFRTAGTTAAKDGQRMQRYFRDLAMARTQFAAQYDRTSEWLARDWFGIPRFQA
jgi:3-hydroxy-9,10-secoandrosta-1,3,5(10)-triene-9,17-dione monooxygenase